LAAIVAVESETGGELLQELRHFSHGLTLLFDDQIGFGCHGIFLKQGEQEIYKSDGPAGVPGGSEKRDV